MKCPCPLFRVSRARSHETLRHRSQDRGAERKIPTVVGYTDRHYTSVLVPSLRIPSLQSWPVQQRLQSEPAGQLNCKSTAHEYSCEFNGFDHTCGGVDRRISIPAEMIDVKTDVKEPPVAVQATDAFLPAAEKEIVRDVTE